MATLQLDHVVVAWLYTKISKIKNDLGGAEGFQGTTGELTQGSLERVFASLSKHCQLDTNSIVLDMGAAIAKPQARLLASGISSVGVECDEVKVDKAHTLLQRISAALREWRPMQQLGTPAVHHTGIEQVDQVAFDSWRLTHAYSFWEGIPTEARIAFGRRFAACPSLRYAAVVQRAFRLSPQLEMMDLGFGPLVLLDSFEVKMSGKGRSFMCYVFVKAQHCKGGSSRPCPIKRSACSMKREPAALLKDLLHKWQRLE